MDCILTNGIRTTMSPNDGRVRVGLYLIAGARAEQVSRCCTLLLPERPGRMMNATFQVLTKYLLVNLLFDANGLPFHRLKHQRHRGSW